MSKEITARRGRDDRHSEHLRELTAARDRVIAAAIAARKIAPDRAEDYRKMFAASPLEIHRLLTARPQDGGLAAGVVAAGNDSAGADEYPTEWLGQEHHPERPTGRVMGEAPAAGPASKPAADVAYPAEWTAADRARSGDMPRVTVEAD